MKVRPPSSVTCYNGAQDRILHTGSWIDIDTGAASGGSPILLWLDGI